MNLARRIIELGASPEPNGNNPEAITSDCLFQSLGTISAIGPREFFSLLKKHGTTKEGELY